jgi:hypothetical protein
MSSDHLGITAILDLVPTASRSLFFVRRMFGFCHNSLKIQLADSLKKLFTACLYVICVLQRGGRERSADHSLQLRLPIYKSIVANMSSVVKQIECKETGDSPSEQTAVE